MDDGPYAEFGRASVLLFTSLPYILFLGFRRLLHKNTPRDSILRFYEQFWGVPLPQEHVCLKDSVPNPNDEDDDDENGREDDGDLLPEMPPPIIGSDWCSLFIRAEYLRIYQWVEGMYEMGNPFRPSAVVVTGQPGIGQYSIIDTRSLFFLIYSFRKISMGLLHPTSTSWGKVCYNAVDRKRVLSLLFRRGPHRPCHIQLQ